MKPCRLLSQGKISKSFRRVNLLQSLLDWTSHQKYFGLLSWFFFPGLIVFVLSLLNTCLLTYLASLGLSCGMQDLCCVLFDVSLQRTDSSCVVGAPEQSGFSS